MLYMGALSINHGVTIGGLCDSVEAKDRGTILSTSIDDQHRTHNIECHNVFYVPDSQVLKYGHT